MATAGGIRAGRAFVELFVEDSRLVRGLRTAQQRLAAFAGAVRAIGLQFTALGAGLAAPLVAASTQFAVVGSALADLSQRTGLSAEALSELAFAAELSGASLHDVEAGVRVMQRTLGAAAQGSESATTALTALGLSAGKLAGLNPEQQFSAIAAAVQTIADPTRRAAAAMQVFGKSGTALLPMIADLGVLRAEARRLGVTMSDEQAAAANDLGDAFDRIRAAIRGVSTVIGSALAPLLKAVAQRVLAFLVGLREWILRNQGLIVTTLKLATVIAGVGVGLVAFAGLAKVAALVTGGLATAFSVLATGIGVAGTLLAGLATPIGAILGAMVALGVGVVAVSQSSGSALGTLGEQFTQLKDDALSAWGGIGDALAAGDIGLAARILWLTLQLEWQRGTAALSSVWTDAVTGMALLFTEVAFGIQRAWIAVVSSLTRVWASFASGVGSLWNEVQGFLAKRFTELLALFDDSIDVAAVQQAIDVETTVRNQALAAEAAVAGSDGEQQIAALEREREAVTTAIAEENLARQDETAADLARARAEFEAAIAQARAGRAAIDSRLSPAAPDAPDLALPDLDALSTALSQKLDTTGSFNAAAIGQLGVGDSTSERTAKASEETAKNTQKLLRAAEDGQLVFG